MNTAGEPLRVVLALRDGRVLVCDANRLSDGGGLLQARAKS